MILADLVILLDRNFDSTDAILHNLSNAGRKHRLLIYNNGCENPDSSLTDLASIYIENTSPVEKTYAECVNELIPYIYSDYVVFNYDFAYYSDEWLDTLINAHIKTTNAGAVSINNDQIQQFTYCLQEDELMGVYEPTKTHSGMFLTSNEILKNVGLFDTELKDQSSFWHYQERISLLGFQNYLMLETFCITTGSYHSNYITSKAFYKRYLAKTKRTQSIFIPIYAQNDNDLEFFKILKNCISAPIQFSDRLGCIIIFVKEINSDDLNQLNDVCKNFKKSFQITASSFYEDLLLKTSILILIK